MPHLFLILVSLVCVLIVYSIYKFYWSRRALYKFANKLSGPSTVFLIKKLFFSKTEDFFNVLCQLMAPFSSPTRFWLGPKLFVYLKSAEHLQTVMQSSKITTKCFIYKFMQPFLGQGLITASGEIHRNAQKQYQAFFTQKMLESYSHLFTKYAAKFVEDIKWHKNGEKFEVISYFNDSAFEASMAILLEKEDCDLTEFEVAKKIVKKSYLIFYERVVSFWLHSDFLYKQTELYKTQENFINIMQSLTDKIIKTKVSEITERIEKLEENENCTKREPSIVELLIEIRKENSNSFSEKFHTDQIITLIAASQDTQSSAMAFTCMLLGMFPKIQDKAYAEVIEVLDGRKIVDFTDASNLKYLEMCIKETLRLFPSIPLVVRDTTEDFQLEADLVIPENVSVALSIFDVHRDPKHWEKPNDFYPEHFTPESVTKRHPYAFVPFSAGPRKCIAQQFAYINMKIMLATILLNYIIESDEKFEDIKLKADISIRPINGYFIKIKKRSAP